MIKAVLSILSSPSPPRLSYHVLEELYETVYLVHNTPLQLSICDLLYCQLPIRQDDFQTGLCDYYLNKKNMMAVDLVESVA